MENLEQQDWDLFLKNTNDPSNIYQTDENPMCPHLFYQLSMVNGFNNLNGHTYSEYIEKYKNIKLESDDSNSYSS